MDDREFSVVTGAFGNTGRFIAQELIANGERVKTLTDHPNRPNPFGDRIGIAPFNFDNPDALTESLRGANTLYNTYWARFCYGGMTYDKAVENSRTLIHAAREAGVRRIVQITVLGASEDSSLLYFRGKGQVERAVIESGLSYSIIRPSVIFGPGGILINNLAWMLSHAPLFVVPGDGEYRMTPVFVEDLAKLAVRQGLGKDNGVVDAVGPETLTFNELIHLIKHTVRSRTMVVHLNPELATFMAGMMGKLVNDIVLEKWETDAMLAGIFASDAPAVGQTLLSVWMKENASSLGVRYFSELVKNYELKS